MDTLLSWLWVIPIAAVLATAGLIWYRTKPQRGIQKSPRKRGKAKSPGRDEQSVEDIATATKKKITKAQTMEEAFAIGKEALDKIKEQIKEPKPKPRKRK